VTFQAVVDYFHIMLECSQFTIFIFIIFIKFESIKVWILYKFSV